RVVPGWNLVMLPVLVALVILAAVGFGSLLAALIVAYRDFRYILQFAVQLWMFATPTIYLLPAQPGSRSYCLLPLSPAYRLLLNCRQAILGGDCDWYALGVSSSVTLVVLAVALNYFWRVERSFADII